MSCKFHFPIGAACRAFVDQILTGQLDPFSESSIPKSEMDAWLRGFRMKVIDVNRINRGSRTGGIGRFSALAVVGNSDVSPSSIWDNTEAPDKLEKEIRRKKKAEAFSEDCPVCD